MSWYWTTPFITWSTVVALQPWVIDASYARSPTIATTWLKKREPEQRAITRLAGFHGHLVVNLTVITPAAI